MTAIAKDMPVTLTRRLLRRVEPTIRPWVEGLVRTAVAERMPRVNDGGQNDTLGLTLGAGTRLDRSVERARIDRLAAEVQAVTGERPGIALTQAYRTLMEVEARGYGRIAGSTYNILGKIVTPALLSPPPGPVLEIGTLYGLFSCALTRHLRRDGSLRHLTVVDPLVGVQEQNGRGIATDVSGSPVSQQIVELNFALAGLQTDDFRIVKGYSGDDVVRAEAGDRKYSIVVVDGDHSDQGVYEDLFWAETVVAPGGIVVMDDFGDKKWPGIEAGAKRYLTDGGAMELIGRVATSGYLRAAD